MTFFSHQGVSSQFRRRSPVSCRAARTMSLDERGVMRHARRSSTRPRRRAGAAAARRARARSPLSHFPYLQRRGRRVMLAGRYAARCAVLGAHDPASCSPSAIYPIPRRRVALEPVCWRSAIHTCVESVCVLIDRCLRGGQTGSKSPRRSLRAVHLSITTGLVKAFFILLLAFSLLRIVFGERHLRTVHFQFLKITFCHRTSRRLFYASDFCLRLSQMQMVLQN